MSHEQLTVRLSENRDALLAQCDAKPDNHDKSYAARKWTVRAILAHLADVEMINLWRFGRSIAEPGATVEAFDQSAWARAHAYAMRPVEVSRGLLLGARDALIHTLATTSPDVLARGSAVHPEKGTLPPLRWAQVTLDHAEHHLSQIVAARAGIKWVPVDRPDAWLFTTRPRPE